MPSNRFVMTLILLLMVTSADAKRPAPAGRNVAAGNVGLPFAVNDESGQQWLLYQGGWFQQQGNLSLYSQGAMFQINANQPNQQTNFARWDDQTNEIVFDDLTIANLLLTRRIQIDAEQGYVRYIDILKNPQAQDAEVSIQIQTNLNYGVNSAEMVDDPRRAGERIGWVAMTGAGRSVVEMFAGKESPVAARLNWPQGNSFVQAMLDTTVPAGKEIAIMHLHGSSAGQQTGVEFLQSLDETKLMLSLPLPLRKLIVNFPQPQNMVGDHEILRGELLDVIELRGGDQLHGTISETTYTLATAYGQIELPVDRVVGLINVGQFRPRQLLVTVDGDVFGGSLAKQTLDITLSSGQNVSVPLQQVSRMGYRKRPGEPEEWSFVKPFVEMQAGDRVGIEPPAEPIEFVTRYGKLAIPPPMIHAIQLQSEEHGVHELLLNDGSRLSGLLAAERIDVALAGADPPQNIAFPTGSAARLQFTAAAAELTDVTPTLDLASGDLLVGALAGELRLDTSFDAVILNASEVSGLTRKAGSQSSDVQITLWDKTALSGQLQESAVQCRTVCGVEVSVPVTLINQYVNPRPQPSAGMMQRIGQLVAELNAEDWKQRDRAEAQLVSLGTTVIKVLNDLRPGQPPEAQKRIDSILQKLAEPEKTGS